MSETGRGVNALARVVPHVQPPRPRIVLLGTGTVGTAFVARHARLRAAGIAVPPIHAVANSRGFTPVHGDAGEAADALRASTCMRDGAWLGGCSFGPGDVVVDASASECVAERHAEWLRAGAHVVTACKLGQGSELARWQGVRAACGTAGTRYGDSATVGAGLPVLRSIRELQAGGDRIHAIAGVLSGSLAWLLDAYDGMRPFSGFVAEAKAAGYTEPDPRDDLSGEDVRRKVLILARTAGAALEPQDVEVASLVPAGLVGVPLAEFEARATELDRGMRQRFADARRRGEVLKFIGRIDFDANGPARASVGLAALPCADPLASGAGTDNRVAIWSDRYCDQPLVIQGPGAGAEITAAALIDDVLGILATAH